MKKDNILDAHLAVEDQETQIRPQMLAEFIGQHAMKENLSVFLEAAKKRSEALDHVLLYGPPGLGKTTIAQIISKEMGVNFRATSGPLLTKAADLAAILSNLEEGDVLFIDEIHRLSTSVEEVLYSAMEDFNLDIIIGEGPAARTVRINLPKFTLVGATTRLGLLSSPLRDRFGIPLRLEFYSQEELAKVIMRGSHILDAAIDEKGAAEIACRSRGTPRIALRLLRRVRDFAHVKDSSIIDIEIAKDALDRLNVDNHGLDTSDHRYMQFIAENYAGGPVGIDTIAAGLSEQKDVIEETIEPYLIKIGFLQRTPRGRSLTPKAMKHLSYEINNLPDSQGNLF